MRIFEGCAAKCLVITDAMPSIISAFGDSFDYLEAAGPQQVARQIAECLERAVADPDATRRRIEAAHSIFEQKLSLEVLTRKMLAEVAERQRLGQVAAEATAEGPTVSVILRCGGRPLSV